MTALQGFWSYVHADDKAEGQRISQLARDVVAQYEMLTGEDINLFLDRDAIEWGENWHDKIDDSLASVGFFVAVLTPRYFMSAECRRELQFFARRAVTLGVRDLILPLIYVDIPSLHDQETTDELVKLVRDFQWEDWTEIRFSDLDSAQYRKHVSVLASRIVKANRQAEELLQSAISTAQIDTTSTTASPSTIDETLQDGSDEQMGVLDLLANAEEKMGQAPHILEELTKEVANIGEIMRQGTEDLEKPNSAKSGFAFRQMIFHRTANKLREPTEHIWSLANELSSYMHTVDQGYRVVFERANEEIKENEDSRANYCSFFNVVRNFVVNASSSIKSTEAMIKSTEPLDKLSRDIRSVNRRLREGLTILVELQGMYDDWLKLIDATGIECETNEMPKQADN